MSQDESVPRLTAQKFARSSSQDSAVCSAHSRSRFHTSPITFPLSDIVNAGVARRARGVRALRPRRVLMDVQGYAKAITIKSGSTGLQSA